LRRELKKDFPDFSYECDAELICRKLITSLMTEADLKEAARTCMNEIEGAFSVCGITKEGNLFAFKDPHGLRPLCSGCSRKKDILAFSSETVGLGINGFNYDFEIEPGEFVTVNRNGFERENLSSGKKCAFCAFEFAYFARPDSKLNGKFVYEVREEFGRNLGKEYSDIVEESDLIVSLPQTSNDATYGLHEATGLRWERSTRRHRYVTERAFMLLPDERFSTIDKKINILNNNVAGKNLIIVDDSIVRGDTTRVIVEKMRNLGAKKIHLFITFPRIIGPCFYGIDMATYGELIGSTRTAEEIAQTVGADSVNYQSLEGFVSATGMKKTELCFGCATGDYPTPLAQRLANWMLKRFEDGHVEEGRIYEIDAPHLM
jgi:amidophosphoribosyltransferase